MPDYDLGTARGRIEIDSSGAVQGFAKASAAQAGLTKNAKSSAAQLAIVGGAMTGVGVAAVAGLGLAINSAASFEERLSAVEAVSGASEKQMESLRKKALQLGADTKFSAGESALAMEELVKAGLSVEDVLNGAADATVNLAAAGEIDLPQAATIASNAMNQFNLAASDMPKVADLIAGAANASAIDVSDFGLAVQQAGATANLVGLSFDDLAVAIAAMGNAGIRGSDAGTSLKTFLANLQPTTEKQISLMRELGLVTEDGANAFFDATGKIKPLNEIAGILGDSLSGLTDQQKALALETIFGSDAIRAAAIIADTGKAGFDKLAESMGKVSAAEVAETRMDNFRGSLEQLKGSLETVAILIGTPFLKALRKVAETFTEWLNRISELNPEILKWAGYITAALGVLLAIGGAIITAVGFFTKLKAALVALKVGALLTNPIGIAIVAVAALAAGLIYLWRNSETFRDIVRKVGEALKAAFEWAKENVPPILQAIADGFRTAFEWVQQNVVPVLQEIGRVFMDTILPALADATDAVLDFGKDVAAVAQDIFGWFSEHVFPVFSEFAELVGAVAMRVRQGAQLMFTVWKKYVELLLKVWRTVWDLMFPIVKFVFDLIRGGITIAMDVIRTVIENVLGFITTAWRLFGDNIWSAVQIVFSQVKNFIETVLGVIQGIIMTVTGVIRGDWKKAWEGIKKIFSSVWHGIKTTLENVIAAVKMVIENALDTIHLLWVTAWNGIKSFLSTALNAMKTAISTTIEAVIEFFRRLPGRILEAVGNLLNLLYQKGRDLISGLGRGISSLWTNVLNFFKELPGNILRELGDVGSLLYNAGKELVNGFWEGMKDIAGDVLGWAGDFAGDIVSGVGRVLGIGSPSKVMMAVGEDTLAGFRIGMENMQRSLLGTAEDIAAMTASSLTPSVAGSGGGGDVINLTFQFGDLTTPEAASAVKGVVSSAEVLGEVVRAVRAGKR